VELRPVDIYEQFLTKYPDWAEKPGATDNLARCRIIDYYRIADAIVPTTDPERVLMIYHSDFPAMNTRKRIS